MILAAVLHFVAPDEADATVAALMTAVAPGSYLILSAGTSTGTDPALIERLHAAYAGAAVVAGRTEAEIAAYFTGLRLEAPGLTDVWAWRASSQRYWPPANARILGGAGRKPAAVVARAGIGPVPEPAPSGSAGASAEVTAEQAASQPLGLIRPA